MPKRIVFTDEIDREKTLLINTFSNNDGLFYIGIDVDNSPMECNYVCLSKEDLLDLSKELLRIAKSIK